MFVTNFHVINENEFENMTTDSQVWKPLELHGPKWSDKLPNHQNQALPPKLRVTRTGYEMMGTYAKMPSGCILSVG